MLKEFKKFILTGNVIDFAVAVILAGALALVLNGFVENIINPILGHLITDGYDLTGLKVVLSEAVIEDGTEVQPENAILYGAWINSIINLILVGLVMFFIVKAYNKTKKPVEAPAPSGPSDNELLTEIRDLLKK
jgi:large conductance mechanosensitive channel